ncbi:thiamine-phosphate kinase [Methylocystis bryophila]|uniref:Thiamine-monophosphate kinase n=1 Tax=Methylocystis bryophila TaxID=655015 RepID=A0A1W6MYN6_9HYPH|nr:thiamine-phosphate kinase [Methylocystis bryophila]ARN82695.1 thiamine-phosphate kinase [Methylocystis bryophila]BDV38921.1 thiamine-monophosphate kinase [Methylocystis bryophila]
MTRRFTEFELIEQLFAPLAGPAGLGLADDAALLPAGEETVATVDALVAGVHFFADDPPGAIAKKALRVNLSDLAAKGAEPLGFLLALALPQDWTNDWLAAFAQGLGEDAGSFSCPLLGGDTVKTPGPLTISITALGCAKGRFVPRTGAKVGDGVFVSGTIGDAALGLRLRKDPALAARLSASSRDFLLERYLLPRPRLELASQLRAGASAAMDVSDGLIGDLAKLARASKVAARVKLEDIPLSEAAREALAFAPDLLETLLCGGDDYEILACGDARLFGVSPGGRRDFRRIGEIVAGEEPPRLVDERGNIIEFSALSFSHF